MPIRSQNPRKSRSEQSNFNIPFVNFPRYVISGKCLYFCIYEYPAVVFQTCLHSMSIMQQTLQAEWACVSIQVSPDLFCSFFQSLGQVLPHLGTVSDDPTFFRHMVGSILLTLIAQIPPHLPFIPNLCAFKGKVCGLNRLQKRHGGIRLFTTGFPSASSSIHNKGSVCSRVTSVGPMGGLITIS